MLGWILLLFVVTPVVELYLLLEIGGRVGALRTLVLVLATGVVGGLVARHQGTRAMRELVAGLRRGRPPSRELATGALFLVGAAFLVTPGVLTDVAGFALMVPAVRRAAAGILLDRLEASDRVHGHVWVGSGAPDPVTEPGPEGPRRVDAEVHEGDDPDDPAG